MAKTARPIVKGQQVWFKSEWQNPGEENKVFVAMDDELGAKNQLGQPIERKTIRVLEKCDLAFQPWNHVELYMID
jgi:hypothetical protein